MGPCGDIGVITQPQGGRYLVRLVNHCDNYGGTFGFPYLVDACWTSHNRRGQLARSSGAGYSECDLYDSAELETEREPLDE